MRSVSIIIPGYNAARTLRETVVSALQSQPPAEVIIVDDGSTDDTLAIAQSFAPHVSILTGPNQGVSAARNRGLAASRGEWLVFLDADDLIEPDSLGLRLQTAAVSRADVVICDWLELPENAPHRGTNEVNPRIADWSLLAQDAEAATATKFWAPPAAILYRKSLVSAIGGFREDLPIIQDARLLFDAALHGAAFARSAHVGARYRISSVSLSRSNPERFYLDVLRNGEQIQAVWHAQRSLTPERARVLHSIFDIAARELHRHGAREWRNAVKQLKRNGFTPSRYVRFASALSGLIGDTYARAAIALIVNRSQ